MTASGPSRGLCRIVTLAILLTASAARPACQTAADCDDGDPCTGDLCGPQGVCQHEVQPFCVACASAEDCDDGNACTGDRCDGGICRHVQIADCPPPRETCGNGIDDDGDGLVDWEDPDCCAATMPLTVSHLELRPASAGGGTRVELRARYAPAAPPLFDPAAKDTSVQISDAQGSLLYATVAASHWAHPARRRYRFEDNAGAFAGGLTKGDFRVRRDGAVAFRTRGRTDARATSGANVRVTIRVGEECAQDTMSLRARRTALVFP
jgi:hypothetical protein